MSLEVIAGGMYSGKTSELIIRLLRARIARLRVVAFKPVIDDRFHESAIANHEGVTFKAIPVKNSAELSKALTGQLPHVVAFDEAQFMDASIIPLLSTLSGRGVRVIVAGLDLDYLGQPFGPIPHLLALADEVMKLRAVCVAPMADGSLCGKDACRSYRLPEADTGAQVQVGAAEAYEARCHNCWAKAQ
jgi:thymidine kinase